MARGPGAPEHRHDVAVVGVQVRRDDAFHGEVGDEVREEEGDHAGEPGPKVLDRVAEARLGVRAALRVHRLLGSDVLVEHEGPGRQAKGDPQEAQLHGHAQGDQAHAHDVDHPERSRESHDRPGLCEGSEGSDDAQERGLEHPEREADHAVRDEDEPDPRQVEEEDAERDQAAQEHDEGREVDPLLEREASEDRVLPQGHDHLAVLNAGDGCGEDVSCGTGVPEAELHLEVMLKGPDQRVTLDDGHHDDQRQADGRQLLRVARLILGACLVGDAGLGLQRLGVAAVADGDGVGRGSGHGTPAHRQGGRLDTL
mmetsp:Transcript_4195/g.12252  ORF Transcript_4195/g.12252 Transcript_4195/m.12252 type:complete len:312 (+) Transcript_4195:603-1538(+)